MGTDNTRHRHLLAASTLGSLFIGCGHASAQSCAKQPDATYLCSGAIKTTQNIPSPAASPPIVRTAIGTTVTGGGISITGAGGTFQDTNHISIGGPSSFGLTIVASTPDDITVSTNGTIASTLALLPTDWFGIYAGSGPQVASSITIDVGSGGLVSGPIGAIGAIGATTGGAGSINITLDGNAARTMADFASNQGVIDAISDSALAGPITIITNGDISDPSVRGYGIVASNRGLSATAGSTIDVTVNGKIPAGGGVSATGTGTVAVTVNGQIITQSATQTSAIRVSTG